MLSVVSRLKGAWQSIRPADALAGAFLSLLLARKAPTQILSTALGLDVVSTTDHNLLAGQHSVDIQGNLFLLMRLLIRQLSTITEKLSHPGGLEWVSTKSPPYSILMCARYLIGEFFTERFSTQPQPLSSF